MIDLEREAPVTLEKAPALVPAINAVPGMDSRKPLCSRTIYNWSRHGKRGVVLETESMGGILVTTREALLRFFARLSEVRRQRIFEGGRKSEDKPPRRSRPNQKQQEESKRQLLQEHGV